MFTLKEESEIELRAMELWEANTGLSYGWGSDFETSKYRNLAREEFLAAKRNKDNGITGATN